MANIDHVNVGTTPYGFDAAALEGRDLDGVMSEVGYHDIIKVTLPGITSLPITFDVTGMTADHEPVQEGFALVTPASSMDGEWTYTSGSGTLAIAGTFSGSTSTTIEVTMGIPDNKQTGTAQS